MKNKCGWDDCFTCPYPDCMIGKVGISVSLARKRKAIELNNSGMYPKEIGVALGLTERQIYRYLKK